MIPVHDLETGFVHEVATGREVALAKLARIDPVLLRDAAVLGNLRTEVALPVERARRAHEIVRHGRAPDVRQALVDRIVLVRSQERPLVLRPWTARRIHVEIEARIRQLEARCREQFVFDERPADVEPELVAVVVRNDLLEHVPGDEALVLKKAERRAFPVIGASTALRADDIRTGSRVFRVVGIHVDAHLIDGFLRQRRSRLAKADDVAVVQALHLDPVHIDVEEAQVRRGTARWQRTSRLRRIRLDARGNGREVHHAALVQREILDLFVHHRRGHGHTLHFDLLDSFPDDFLLRELGDALLHLEVEPGALSDHDLYGLFGLLVSQGSDGHRVLAGEQSDNPEFAIRPRCGLGRLVRRCVDDRHLGVGDWCSLRFDRTLERDRVLSARRTCNHHGEHCADEQTIKQSHGESLGG